MSTGYDLMKLLAERSGGVYRASAGAIYPTLQELQDEGLATADQQNAKRVYRITEEGRHELEREGATVRAIWRRAQRWREWRTAFDPGVAKVVRPARGQGCVSGHLCQHRTRRPYP